MMFAKRLNGELTQLLMDPPTYFNAVPVADDIARWKATIMGPADSPYAGGAFNVSIVLPSDYPFSAPHVNFDTKIYHPNIFEFGPIRLDILDTMWTPAITISKLLLIITWLLRHPDPDEGLDLNITSLYQTERPKFESTARYWTRLYAMG